MEFVKQEFWDKGYVNYQLEVASDRVTSWLDKHLSEFSDIDSCLEIGCYPGRYLAFFGKKGLVVNGIDLTPDIENKLGIWFKKIGVEFEDLIRGDFLDRNNLKTSRYKLVYSVGVIEHFHDYLRAIKEHLRFVDENGFIVISTPNFSGKIQRYLHSILDAKNLDRHNLESMDPDGWAALLGDMGYQIHFCGYFGGFDFWADKEERSVSKKLIIFTLKIFSTFMYWIPNSKSYSPYCGVIASKINNSRL